MEQKSQSGYISITLKAFLIISHSVPMQALIGFLSLPISLYFLDIYISGTKYYIYVYYNIYIYLARF